MCPRRRKSKTFWCTPGVSNFTEMNGLPFWTRLEITSSFHLVAVWQAQQRVKQPCNQPGKTSMPLGSQPACIGHPRNRQNLPAVLSITCATSNKVTPVLAYPTCWSKGVWKLSNSALKLFNNTGRTHFHGALNCFISTNYVTPFQRDVSRHAMVTLDTLQLASGGGTTAGLG